MGESCQPLSKCLKVALVFSVVYERQTTKCYRWQVLASGLYCTILSGTISQCEDGHMAHKLPYRALPDPPDSIWDCPLTLPHPRLLFVLCSVCFQRSCRGASGCQLCPRRWWSSRACASLWPPSRPPSSLSWPCLTWWERGSPCLFRGALHFIAAIPNWKASRTEVVCQSNQFFFLPQCFVQTECSSDITDLPLANCSHAQGLEGDLFYLPVSNGFVTHRPQSNGNI